MNALQRSDMGADAVLANNNNVSRLFVFILFQVNLLQADGIIAKHNMARQAGTDRDLLAMALVGYEAAKAKINAAIAEIQAKLGHRGRPRVATDEAAPAKRTMSAAARKRIAAAQRKRWAAVREQGKSAAKLAAPKKRKLSADDRALRELEQVLRSRK